MEQVADGVSREIITLRWQAVEPRGASLASQKVVPIRNSRYVAAARTHLLINAVENNVRQSFRLSRQLEQAAR